MFTGGWEKEDTFHKFMGISPGKYRKLAVPMNGAEKP